MNCRRRRTCGSYGADNAYFTKARGTGVVVPPRRLNSRSCEQPLEAGYKKAVSMRRAIDVSESKYDMEEHAKQCHPGYRLRSSQPFRHSGRGGAPGATPSWTIRH